MAASRQDKTYKLGFFLIKKVPCECLCSSGCLLYVMKGLLPSLKCGRNHFAQNVTQCHSKWAPGSLCDVTLLLPVAVLVLAHARLSPAKFLSIFGCGKLLPCQPHCRHIRICTGQVATLKMYGFQFSQNIPYCDCWPWNPALGIF